VTIIVWVVIDEQSQILPEHCFALTEASLEARYQQLHGHPMIDDGLRSVQATVMI
jgi:hypothetical protein